MNNLPILYTIPRWNLIKGSKAKIQYYIPYTNKWVSNRTLNKELNKIGLTSQSYYDRWFLNITTPSQRPKCKSCKIREVLFNKKEFLIAYRFQSCGCPECNKAVLSMNRSYLSSNRSKESLDKTSESLKLSYKNDPTASERRAKSIHERNINDPESRKRRSNATKLMATEDYRMKMSRIISERYQNPKEREKTGLASKRMWMNPSDAMKHRRRNSSIDYYSDYENKIIHLDSKWELKFIENCKLNPNIKSVLREPIMIWYYDSTTSKMRRYFPDFLVEYNNGKKELIEIKPNYLLTDPIVKAKESYSIKYCSENNLSYKFITEDHLF